ncbi:MAG: 23S rRNA (pseudouridine(1915)-N(3))-methyltransferase RlmH [Candidatus Nomurabacteria bacterium]|jgi:23S rRNA (pseudouridine1915-N3)-methyltransferase|nr:23S rRNA (pseudouridine(1915)-N(3))-methyltransferase RlmH [Candidatus Nomurabacteria bacterium]
MIKIITVGKKQEQFVGLGIAEYEKRLRKPFDLEWVVLADGDKASEEKAILRAVGGSGRSVAGGGRAASSSAGGRDFVILLDERGKNLSSPEFAEILQEKLGEQNVVLVIGGSLGVTDTVRARADLVWSLSRLVFPHQLVRLLVSEQIYRAQTLANGQNYHKY